MRLNYKVKIVTKNKFLLGDIITCTYGLIFLLTSLMVDKQQANDNTVDGFNGAFINNVRYLLDIRNS